MNSRTQRLRAMLKHDRLGGQAVMAFGLKIWGAAASFGLSLMIARTYGATGSGYFGVATTTVLILTYVVLAGLDYTVVRAAAGDLREGKLAEARGAIAAGTRVVAIAGPLLVGALWLGKVPLARDLLHQPVAMFGIMILAVVPNALQRMASSALRSSNRVLWSQWVDGPFGTTLAVVVLGGMIVAGYAGSMSVPATVYVGGTITGCCLGWLVFKRHVRGWPATTYIRAWPLVLAGLPIVASNLSNVFTEWYTTVSLGIYWPAAVVGQYRVAWQFVGLAGLVQVAMDTIIGPRIAAAARVGARGEIASIARKSLLLSVGLATPLFIALIAFPRPLLGVFGEEFQAGALTLQILAIGQLVRLASGPLGSILVMTGNQRWVLAYSAAGVVLCIVFVAIFVQTYGALGAALATGATVILRNVAAALIVHRVLGINLLRRAQPPA